MGKAQGPQTGVYVADRRLQMLVSLRICGAVATLLLVCRAAAAVEGEQVTMLQGGLEEVLLQDGMELGETEDTRNTTTSSSNTTNSGVPAPTYAPGNTIPCPSKPSGQMGCGTPASPTPAPAASLTPGSSE